MITNELIVMIVTTLISNLLNINLKSFYLNLEFITNNLKIKFNISFSMEEKDSSDIKI